MTCDRVTTAAATQRQCVMAMSAAMSFVGIVTIIIMYSVSVSSVSIMRGVVGLFDCCIVVLLKTDFN